jgi:hypothetical protein
MRAREEELAGLAGTEASISTKSIPLTPMSLTTTSKGLCIASQQTQSSEQSMAIKAFRAHAATQLAALAMPQP